MFYNYDWHDKIKIGLFLTANSGSLHAVPKEHYVVGGRKIYIYDEIKTIRLKPTYRMDINYRYLFKAYAINWELNSSLYNVLGSPNPIASQYSHTGKLQQFSLGFIPSFGIKCSF